MTASTFWTVALKFGLSPHLQTPKQWHAVAQAKTEEERERLVPSTERFCFHPKVYLDDCCLAVLKYFSNKTGTRFEAKSAPQLLQAIAQSAIALAQAFGWTISVHKCFIDPFLRKVKYLGWNCLMLPDSNMFELPEYKRVRNLTKFTHFFHLIRWRLHQISTFTGLVMSMRIVWGQLAFQIACPLFEHIKHHVRSDGSVPWNQTITPSVWDKRCVERAIRALTKGPSLFTSKHMVTRQMRIIRNYRDDVSSLDSAEKIMTDASDIASGGFKSNLSIPELFKATFETLIKNPKIIATYKLLTPEMILLSSTVRELEAIRVYYSPEMVQELLRGGSATLLHFVDSKCAALALAKGGSSVPAVRDLVNAILDQTAPLRSKRGLCWIWVKREHNACADALSKETVQLQIDSVSFNFINEFLVFSLDGFASQEDVVQPPQGPIFYCSRFAPTTPSKWCLGDAQFTSWAGHTVWCFPTPSQQSLSVVALAINKCEAHTGLAVLAIPIWAPAPSWTPLVNKSTWVASVILPPRTTFKKCVHEGAPINKPSSFPLKLYIYNTDHHNDARISAFLSGCKNGVPSSFF